MEDVRSTFAVNDAVNLLFGLPVSIAMIWLFRTGAFSGALCLPGALFYMVYNSLAYAAAMPFTWLSFVHLGLAGLCVYAIFLVLAGVGRILAQERIPLQEQQARPRSRSAERFGAVVLIGFGSLFFLRAVVEIFNGAPAIAEFGVLVADALTTPFWILGGILLWRKRPLGYLSAAGLLFQASMLFIALLVFFIFQSFAAGVPFPLADFLVILAMGSIVFASFGLYMRRVIPVAR